MTPRILAWAERFTGGDQKPGGSYDRSTGVQGDEPSLSAQRQTPPGHLGGNVCFVENTGLELKKGVGAGGKGLAVSTFFRKESGLSTFRSRQKHHPPGMV